MLLLFLSLVLLCFFFTKDTETPFVQEAAGEDARAVPGDRHVCSSRFYELQNKHNLSDAGERYKGE